MGDQRQYTRMKGDSANCILMELDGSSYRALLENISIGGAFIKVSEGIQNGLQVGDECTFTLCSDSNGCTSRHFCRVVRHDAANMGIQFITNRDQ